MMRRLLFVIFALSALVQGQSMHAHEVRPALLEITETKSGIYDVTWKQPVRDGRRLKLEPTFSEGCEPTGQKEFFVSGALITQWSMACELHTISIAGLDRTLTDALVRLTSLDAETKTYVLKPGSSRITPGEAKGAAVPAYLGLGIEHILFGFDHVLFVIGLMVLVHMRQLFLAITSFTFAHSLTLGLSAIGGISLPGPPVEIVIAISLVLLAREGIGRLNGEPDGLTARFPWVVAFGFGLIHGFGFAGALAEIGLPEGATLRALFLFNLGVEIGQLMIVAVLLIIGAGLQYVLKGASILRSSKTICAYCVGTAGIYWTAERIWGSFGGVVFS